MSLKYVTVEIGELKWQFYSLCHDPQRAKEYMERMIHALASGKTATVSAGDVGSEDVE